ncbi:MAG: S9 family peptidase [Acidobacteriota bacterium]
MKKFLFAAAIFLLPALAIYPQQKHALTVDDLWAMKRVSSPVISSDGKTIAFVLTSYSMDQNKGNADIWLVNSDGSNLRFLKNSDKNETEPHFLPDGKGIVYSVGGQLHECSLEGSGDKELTDIYSTASGEVLSNDGSKIAFVSPVYPGCTTQECNKQKDEEKEKSKVKASIFTELMYRHWDDWRGEKRSHLFLMNKDKKEYTDLTLNSKADVPPIALGSSNDYNFSPDGQEIAFTMNEAETLAVSTNNDIFIVKLKDVNKDGKTPYTKISVSRGNDNNPVYSPDGNYIAYCSMERAGFEADRQRLMLYDRKTGTTKDLTKGFDRSVSDLTWSPDSKAIYFDCANEVYNSIYRLDLATDKIDMLLKEHINNLFGISPDGKTIYFSQMRTNLPTEIFSMNSDGSNLKQLTSSNTELLSKLEMNPIETFWSKGAAGAKVQSILVKPPFFDPNKKYPMMFLIHGGPQGHWEDDFHYRWNLQMFAAQGYVVVAPNPRGSTGYGQKFTDEISGDWGGKPYVDLMNAYDYVISKYNFVDRKNTFAAGASYGGYMINWIEGHTDRFNALVCHDGVFNLESMYGTTEELWFPEWENKGKPWTNRPLYRKFSPHEYVENFKTPMLIVQGGMDFRVPEEQAFQNFTSLQRKGVESKFLYFPEETHFVVRPQNARLWWNTVFDWFNKHYKRQGI